MVLRPGEPRALKQIEERLAASDPSLAAMLAVFTADPSRAGQCSRPAPSRRVRPKYVAVLVVLVIGLVACATMAALTAP